MTYSINTTYTFTVEDYTPPQLLSAFAVGPKTIRLTFSEAMRLIGDGAAADALTAAGHSFAFMPATDTQAGVAVVATSVASVSDTVVDVTTDIELSFWRTYRVTCAATIADDSGNPMDSTALSVEFASWVPPYWPPDRRFSIWDNMLSGDDRQGDIAGDLARLVSAWQDTLDLQLYDLDRFESINDIDTMPEPHLDALLEGLGNPYQIVLSALEKRKLAAQLVASYQEIGQDNAIINLARFFLDLTVTVTADNASDQRWVVGVSEVAITTVLGPSAGSRGLYSFSVYSPTVLTATQRQYLNHIVRTVKAAHEHYIITDPSDVPEYDPWEIGLSQVGVDTIVH